ncbi:MAG: hypothetical protein HFF05_05810 [Oscillospiraceae bacterium]|nr:hypothetical protein [Oscillospiraceae bacterium]
MAFEVGKNTWADGFAVLMVIALSCPVDGYEPISRVCECRKTILSAQKMTPQAAPG